MSVSRLSGCAWAWVVVLMMASGARAVVNGTPAPNADKRFDAVGLFMRTSSAGGCAGWVSGTCTLVGPTTVLIARHCLDINTSDPLPSGTQRQYRVRFRRAANGLSENAMAPDGFACHGVYQEIDVVRLVDAANTTCDQVLAYLASAPLGIQPIVPALANPPLLPTNVILAGWGYTGECYATGSAWTLRIARGRTPSNWAGNDYLSFSSCTESNTAPCLTCPSSGGPFVNANLHDSGAPILMEVPSVDPSDPTPELRLIGTVSSSNTARRPSAWNSAGGLPALTETPPPRHLRRADFDGDGHTTVSDLMAFLSAFFSGRMDADTSGNGTLEIADVMLYLTLWFS